MQSSDSLVLENDRRSLAADGFQLLRGALRKAREDDIATAARALAYSLFLAIPAGMLVVLGVFSLFADERAVESVVRRAGTLMPEEATTLLRQSLLRSIHSTHSGVFFTVVGLALAVWTMNSAAATLMHTVTLAFDREDRRGFVRKRALALVIDVVLVLGAAFVFASLVFGPYLERWSAHAVGAPGVMRWLWWTAEWPILLGVLLLIFSVVLYLGADVDEPRWQLVTPGAVTAFVIWLAASIGFAVYTSHFGSYQKTWGTLSAVVITLVWLWLTSAALLFGAEVNAEAERRSRPGRGGRAAG